MKIYAVRPPGGGLIENEGHIPFIDIFHRNGAAGLECS